MKFFLILPKIYLILILSAASSLIYETVATNILFFYFIKSSYSVATVLSVFLFGLGLGSFIVHKYTERIKDIQPIIGILQLLLASYGILVLYNLSNILSTLNSLNLFIVSFLILLFPTLILGATFPLAGHIIYKTNNVKLDISGLVYSVDLIGAVLGTAVAGFLLIPVLGNSFTILFATLLNMLAASIALKSLKKMLGILGIIFIVTLIYFQQKSNDYIFSSNKSASVLNPETETAKTRSKKIEDFISSGLPIPAEVIFKKASPYGEIILEGDTLYIDERVQCALSYEEDASERTIVSLSLNPFQSRNLNVLNIGLGCGLTAKEILKIVDTMVDVIEINPVVVEANKILSSITDDKNLNLIIDDGLHYLRNTNKKYETIIIDIESPAVIHASDIYTFESFKIIFKSLTSQGIFGLWAYGCDNDEYTDLMYYTLKEVFPYVYKPNHAVFIAAKQKLEYEKYFPKTAKKINTLDKKNLSKIYIDKCEPLIKPNDKYILKNFN